MAALCCGLVSSSPERPSDDACGLDAALGEARGDAAEFLDRPADKGWRAWVRGRRGGVFCGGAWLAWWRMLAIMANASMTKLT